MSRKVEIGEKSKVNIQWRVLPIDYSKEKAEEIEDKFAKKYDIPRKNVTVTPIFVHKDNLGNITEYNNEIITSIQNPKFQQELFKKYIEEREIKNYDFDEIIKIDDFINNGIDYDSYEGCTKYMIKWLKWSNFMSYGPDNYFDFTKLNGLVLLTSEPSNQGGKSTFSIDILRFLLFGKVTSRESDWTLAKAFNSHLPEATEVVVEGCIMINGVDYVIKRVLTRPALKKRTEKSKVTQKVYYYKVVNGEYLDLVDEDDVENTAGASTTETNRIIKESIGNERDFDLMICVSSDNLKGLISLKDAERGRLISRWIGLLPLEEKDKLARETFNKTVVPKLIMNKYNKEDLKASVEDMTKTNEDLDKEISDLKKKIKESELRLDGYSKERDALLQSKSSIDDSLTKIDVETLKTKLEEITQEGKRKREEKNKNEAKLKELLGVTFDKQTYIELSDKKEQLNAEIVEKRSNYKIIEKDIEQLKKAEFCPTCGAKLKDVDNSKTIAEKETLLEEIKSNGSKMAEELKRITESLSKMETNRENYNEKQKLEIIVEKNEADIKTLALQYREVERTMKDIEKNKEAIEKNNKIDAAINVADVNIKTEKNIIDTANTEINSKNMTKAANLKAIETNNKYIGIIEQEEKTVRNWKIYLDMIGKNGISKLVLRDVLPFINGQLRDLLSPDVCDFTVEIVIDDHNDVAFNLIHDGVKSNLASGSGFEQTVASLALRSVLSTISSFSRPSFVVFDEVLGGVADENYDNVRKLYEKMVKNYGLCLQISHLKNIVEWHSSIITIKKENNISKIVNN